MLNQEEARFGRFFVVGLASITTYYVIFVSLTEFTHVWYIMSSAIAFGGFFTVDFLGHKYVTFRNESQEQMHEQLVHFSLVAIGSWVVGTAFLYIAVEYFHLWYLLAQGVITVISAIVSYLIMRWIFRHRR